MLDRVETLGACSVTYGALRVSFAGIFLPSLYSQKNLGVVKLLSVLKMGQMS